MPSMPDAVSLIALCAAGFVGTHLSLSHPSVRARAVARLGEGPFALAYSLVTLAFYVPMVLLWWTRRHAGAALWVWRSPAAVHLAELVTAAGVALAVAALVQPAPSAHTTRQREHSEVRGMAHVTRHPLFVGIALIAGGHLLVNGWASDVVFLGAHLVLGLVGAAHQDARLRAARPSYAAFAAQTSIWPNPLGLPRIGARAATGLAAGLVLAAALRYAHRWF
jgi:uncharacterized membrane protein